MEEGQEGSRRLPSLNFHHVYFTDEETEALREDETRLQLGCGDRIQHPKLCICCHQPLGSLCPVSVRPREQHKGDPMGGSGKASMTLLYPGIVLMVSSQGPLDGRPFEIKVADSPVKCISEPLSSRK
ncbi:hypothetical protein H1C71_029390 [Ictidomys tridecemlineatus]|nr:hypothetical protein H1C71_029390 [Ictidomys tridecemlineatus]